jgi:SAM-dependent methyltransferase
MNTTENGGWKKKLRRETRRLAAQVKRVGLSLRLGTRWESAEGQGARRVYSDYDTYLQHQRLKLDAFRESSIVRHDRKFRPALRERLAALGIPLRGASVLCLAARQGSEVKAFTDLGAFAVGIDLNPGPDNRHVLVGDFHDLQFADESVDVVYTNSMDHVYELERMLGEIRRVLAAGGTFITEVGPGIRAGEGQGFYESFAWESVDALLARIEAAGFALERRSAFTVPWQGEQLVLRKAAMA